MTKEYLHAEYRRSEDAAASIELLREAGIARNALELYSRRPLEAHPPVLPRRSRMSLGAVAAAVASGSLATALMFWVQREYPLVTGGMPITSGWATGVVTFETTMAGAVIGILAMLLLEAGLPGSRRRVPLPDLPDEGIVLQVRCDGNSAAVRASLGGTAPVKIEIVEFQR